MKWTILTASLLAFTAMLGGSAADAAVTINSSTVTASVGSSFDDGDSEAAVVGFFGTAAAGYTFSGSDDAGTISGASGFISNPLASLAKSTVTTITFTVDKLSNFNFAGGLELVVGPANTAFLATLSTLDNTALFSGSSFSGQLQDGTYKLTINSSLQNPFGSFGTAAGTYEMNITAAPEPASLAMWSMIGLAGAGGAWRKRRKLAGQQA